MSDKSVEEMTVPELEAYVDRTLDKLGLPKGKNPTPIPQLKLREPQAPVKAQLPNRQQRRAQQRLRRRQRSVRLTGGSTGAQTWLPKVKADRKAKEA